MLAKLSLLGHTKEGACTTTVESGQQKVAFLSNVSIRRSPFFWYFCSRPREEFENKRTDKVVHVYFAFQVFVRTMPHKRREYPLIQSDEVCFLLDPHNMHSVEDGLRF